MKQHYHWHASSDNLDDFQFLWGWNIGVDAVVNYAVTTFQFLWGWNTVIGRLTATLARCFQFLWGWNSLGALTPQARAISFNSFEDKTFKKEITIIQNEFKILSIPLRMKLFCGMLVLHTQTLSIPLRMKPAVGEGGSRSLWEAFNSFEDETPKSLKCGGNDVLYSSFNSFEDETTTEVI